MTNPLQQLADHLCRGFCGWRLQHDRRVLTRLGTGTLYVDLLTKTCRFDRHYIPPLVIVDRLAGELRRHTDNHGIAANTLRSSRLKIKLSVDEHEEQKDRSVMWFGEHDGFLGCQMEIEACVTTADESYSAKHSAYVEWPRERSGDRASERGLRGDTGEPADEAHG